MQFYYIKLVLMNFLGKLKKSKPIFCKTMKFLVQKRPDFLHEWFESCQKCKKSPNDFWRGFRPLWHLLLNHFVIAKLFYERCFVWDWESCMVEGKELNHPNVYRKKGLLIQQYCSTDHINKGLYEANLHEIFLMVSTFFP